MADEKLHEVESAYDKVYSDARDTSDNDISAEEIKDKVKNGASSLIDKLDKWTLKHPNITFGIVIGGGLIGCIELTKKILSDAIYSANKRTYRYIDRSYRK